MLLLTPPPVLAPCPDSPNCVSTETADRHSIEPLPYEGTAEGAISRLRRVVEAIPRARVTSTGETWLTVEFRTLIFRFVDDAVFVADPVTRTIRMRSAARSGYYDFGHNRRRLETIRRLFAAPQA